MKRRNYIIFLIVVFWGHVVGLMGQVPEVKISSAKEREKLLSHCKSFLEDNNIRKKKDLNFGLIADPFYYEGDDKSATEETSKETSDNVIKKDEDPQEVLKILAKSINPTGLLKSGGSYILLFGNNFVRKGEIISLTLNGISYPVQVADIGEYDFVLKFKDAKITKPLDVTTVKMADAEGDDKNPK